MADIIKFGPGQIGVKRQRDHPFETFFAVWKIFDFEFETLLIIRELINRNKMYAATNIVSFHLRYKSITSNF